MIIPPGSLGIRFAKTKHRSIRGKKEKKRIILVRHMEIFDLRKAIISFSLLHICNRFKRMQPGEVIEIITRDASIADDIARILPELTYETSLRKEPCGTGAVFYIQLKKSDSEGSPDSGAHPLCQSVPAWRRPLK